MLITEREIDDFKSDRKDITPPLPVVLRLVPLLFYCSIAVAVILSSIFAIQFQLAVQKRDNHKARTAALGSETQDARNQRAALEAQIKKATDIQSWVASSRPIQPLIVEMMALGLVPEAGMSQRLRQVERIAEFILKPLFERVHQTGGWKVLGGGRWEVGHDTGGGVSGKPHRLAWSCTAVSIAPMKSETVVKMAVC